MRRNDPLESGGYRVAERQFFEECDQINNFFNAIQMRNHPKKVVFVGDAGVGKTCIIHRSVRREFLDDCQPTVGTGFDKLSVPVDGNEVLTFEIWDTAGQERYRSLTPRFFKQASAGIFVFDLSNPQSLEPLKFYHQAMCQICGDNIVIVLVGNKTDLEEARQVPLEDILALKSKLNIAYYIECSAKTGQGVMDIFRYLAHEPKIRGNELEVQGTALHLPDESAGKCAC